MPSFTTQNRDHSFSVPTARRGGAERPGGHLASPCGLDHGRTPGTGQLTSTASSAPGPGREREETKRDVLRRWQRSCGELGFSENFPVACRGIRRQTGKAAPAPLGTVAPACCRLENRQSKSVRNAGGEERKGRRGGKGAGSPHAARLPMTKGREGGVRAGEGRGGKGEGEEAKGRGATWTDAKLGSARPEPVGLLGRRPRRDKSERPSPQR